MKNKKTSASLTSVDDKKRVEVRVADKPQQIFDITTLLDYEPFAEKLKGQSYRVYSSDNTIIQTGIMGDATSIIKTPIAMKIRCEIGSGKWQIQEDGYNDIDVDRLESKQEASQ